MDKTYDTTDYCRSCEKPPMQQQMDDLKIGMKVFIKRSDGRVQKAAITRIIKRKMMVSVEWGEKDGGTNGKDLFIVDLLKMEKNGDKTDDERDSDGETTSGGKSAATTNNQPTTTPAATTAEKKKTERVPNMLLLATKEDDTQSEAQIPSKRKTKVDKNNKEPAPTKNVTLDPGAIGTKGILAAATGKPVTVATTKTSLKRTDTKTGIPKSETATDKDGQAATKGVSATQGDKVTENYETRPTQLTATMATDDPKPTTLGTTQFATQTTQGGSTTAGGITAQTAIAKTRLTGPTQMPSADTNDNQMPTGGATTKTKPIQFATNATKTKGTQFVTGGTQKTGTTKAGTGTTQRGTTMATGATQHETAGTQARTGTRQTGETQNPDKADINIDPTQIAGTTAATTGGSRPTIPNNYNFNDTICLSSDEEEESLIKRDDEVDVAASELAKSRKLLEIACEHRGMLDALKNVKQGN